MSKTSNKKVMITAVIMIVMGLIFSLSKSYAYFETSIAGSNVTLGVGKLIHSLNNDVKLQNGEKKQIDLIVKSNDDIASKYQVYYKSSNDLTGVLVGYSQDSIDLPSGEIEAKGVKNITIVLENNSSNEVSVEIGVRGGLSNNSVEDIVLEEGENRITDVMDGVGEEEFVCDTTATATSADITEGKTAWVNGELITGTRKAASGAQSGSYTVRGTDQTTNPATKVITFSPAFDNIPNITLSSSNSSITATVSSVSETQLVINTRYSVWVTIDAVISWRAEPN